MIALGAAQVQKCRSSCRSMFRRHQEKVADLGMILLQVMDFLAIEKARCVGLQVPLTTQSDNPHE